MESRRSLLSATAALIAAVCLSVLLLSSCKGGGDDDTTRSTYKYTGTSSVQTTAPDDQGGPESWKSNYSLTYVYYRDSQSSEISEIRAGDVYLSIDKESGIASFFNQDGSDVEEYLVYPDEMTAEHTSHPGKSLDSFSSGFMRLSQVDPDFTDLSNVKYVGAETVAGRQTKQYVQRSYSSGKLTGSAFICIDDEYGFAVKGEQYDGSNDLVVYWELTEFHAGDVPEVGLEMDLTGYKITEKQ